MNYRTIQGPEDQFLLSNGSERSEDLHTNDESRAGVTKRESADEDIELLKSTEKVLPKTTKQLPTRPAASGINQNTRYSESRDIEHDLNITSNAWVEFEESNTSSDVVEPKQKLPTALRDNSNSGSLSNEDDWVKFDNAKENNDLRSLKKNYISNAPSFEESGDQKQETDINLPCKESLTNPFHTSELDRISSFSKTSKTVNGASSNLTKPLCLHETAENSQETQASINGSVQSEDVLNTPLPAYPIKYTNTTWSMLLRYPDAKQRIRGREWRPVVLKLNGSILQVYNEHDLSAPFREVSLQCFYDLTKPQLQNYNGIKVHTVKILYVKYKETHRLISKKNVQYIARTTPILKIASFSHTDMREFIEVVRDAIRSLPIFRDRGISHHTEAVYIDVHDTCSAIIDIDGSVLMLGILVRIYLRAFISGDAECELVLNDIHQRTQEEARLRGELMPQRVHKWIKLEECNFHNTVSRSSYNQNHCIMLHPLDSCTFEVMQFRVCPAKPLPLLAKCELIIDTLGGVELRAEVKLCSDPKLAKYERKNVCLYFSIPAAWVPLFMKEKRFHGEKSITSTNSQKAIKMRNRKNRSLTTIEVSTGSAKYEMEFKSIVWRIEQLPLLNTTAPADSTHDFVCHVQTTDSSSLPDDFKPNCVMEYDIPYTVASDTNVVNFKVLDKKISTKEVSYHTYYSYDIQINMTRLNGGVQHER